MEIRLNSSRIAIATNLKNRVTFACVLFIPRLGVRRDLHLAYRIALPAKLAWKYRPLNAGCCATCRSNLLEYPHARYRRQSHIADDVVPSHDLHSLDAIISNALPRLESDDSNCSPVGRKHIPGHLQRSVNSGLGALVPVPKIDICRPRHIRLISSRSAPSSNCRFILGSKPDKVSPSELYLGSSGVLTIAVLLRVYHMQVRYLTVSHHVSTWTHWLFHVLFDIDMVRPALIVATLGMKVDIRLPFVYSTCNKDAPRWLCGTQYRLYILHLTFAGLFILPIHCNHLFSFMQFCTRV